MQQGDNPETILQTVVKRVDLSGGFVLMHVFLLILILLTGSLLTAMVTCPSVSVAAEGNETGDENDEEDESNACGLLFFLFGVTFFGMLWLTQRIQTWKVERALEKLEKMEPIWNRDRIERFASESFMTIKQAWSDHDRDTLRGLLTPELYEEWEDLLDDMEDVDQRNVIEDLSVNKLTIIEIQDHTDDEQDSFTAELHGDVVDYTADSNGDPVKPLWSERAEVNPFKESGSFEEFWTYSRHNDSWQLAKIEQRSAELHYTLHGPVLDDEKHAGKELKSSESQSI